MAETGSADYLTVDEVVLMHQELMAGAGRTSILRDAGALESAVPRPYHAAHHAGADLYIQAATLMAGIALCTRL